MSAPNDTTKASSPPESPTTARPFELDDDDVPEPGPTGEEPRSIATVTSATTGAPDNETPPPKPPRPLTEQQKNELILKEAFPSVELGVIKAVLSASRAQIEPAFNALLEMTDPDAVKNEPHQESPPPQQPPRPNNTARSQLEADEIYARQLAEHYENVSAYEARTTNRQPGQQQGYAQRQSSRAQPRPLEPHDREYSFIDDELPVLRENLRKGFADTQVKVNGWIQTLKKKMDEAFDDDEDAQGSQGYGRGQAPYGGVRQPGTQNRRSGDYHRYDADPEVLGDDFAGIKLSPDGSAAAAAAAAANQSRNPAAKPAAKPPSSSTSPRPERKVGFKEETEDIYSASPLLPSKDNPLKPAVKSSKWQPLTTVDAAPMAENDPFSLGDSDDDKEVAKEPINKSSTGQSSKLDDDNERLKQAAAEAMADSLVDSKSGSDSAKKD